MYLRYALLGITKPCDILTEQKEQKPEQACHLSVVPNKFALFCLFLQISRQVFARMKSYIIYRITASLQVLMFFFLSVMFMHPSA